METFTEVERALTYITLPVEGLVLTSTWDDPAHLLTEVERHKVLAACDAPDTPQVNCSADDEGHWADIVQVSRRHWVVRHVEEWADTDSLTVFGTYEAAWDHYAAVVAGQQDARYGNAWERTDVPGVLDGEHWRMAQRAGLPYEQAARAYRNNRALAVAAWQVVGAYIR